VKQPKVSILFLVFESYEMVRRQVLYMNSLGLPEEVEVLFVDDGSNPPVILYDEPSFRHGVVYRDKEPGETWTIPKAINFGASKAKGKFLFFLGADHMLSPELVEFFLRANVGYAVFRRKYAVMDRDGSLLKMQYRHKPRLGFVDCEIAYTALGWIKRGHFFKVGGMAEELSGPSKGNADVGLFAKWCRMRGTTRAEVIKRGERNNPTYYMLPEKRTVKLSKERRGEHWHYFSYLRPVRFLHRLPERDPNHKAGAVIPLERDAKTEERIRFVYVNGWQKGKVSGRKFSDFIQYRYPAEIRWMLREFK
jgi:hypothetical protein